MKLFRTPNRDTQRRGNAIVLVAAILVLLVIIAAAYITRTQTQRQVSVATQKSVERTTSAEQFGRAIAREIADALFVWPIDTTSDRMYQDTGRGIADANVPRLRPEAIEDLGGELTRHNVDPRYPYVFAPFETVPRTNWPSAQAVTWLLGGDPLDPADVTPNARFLPSGPGNFMFDDGIGFPGDGADPDLAAILSSETNPMGNPGTGDARWLADSEPVRWDSAVFIMPLMPQGDGDAFMFWRKMTNIARANNSWRVIGDISNVDQSIVSDLNIPIEQWLPVRPFVGDNWASFQNRQLFAPVGSATTNYNQLAQFGNNWFMNQWGNWFGLREVGGQRVGIAGYLDSYLGKNTNIFGVGNFGIPPNFYKLSDLNANKSTHTFNIGGVPQDTPQAAFVPGTARHTVGRVLADTTGDGFTDAFWFDPGTGPRDGLRQIVAVRIVDNSAMINPNTATQFVRRDRNNPEMVNGAFNTSKTRGHTPADIALVGDMNPNVPFPPSNTWDLSDWSETYNVGFYDSALNWRWVRNDGSLGFTQRYGLPGQYNLATSAGDLWKRHVHNVGLTTDQFGDFQLISLPNNHISDDHNWRTTQRDRLRHWQWSGRHGIDNSTDGRVHGYTSYGLMDELSLRMLHGNNSRWLHSPYEQAMMPQHSIGASDRAGFVRSNRWWNESSEYHDQLKNRQLVRDNRRKLTMHSGARNDLLPPSLQWRNRYDYNVSNYANLPPLARNAISYAAANVQGGPQFFAQVVAPEIFNRFTRQSRTKLDLREPELPRTDSGLGGPPGPLQVLGLNYYDWTVDSPQSTVPGYPGGLDNPDFGRLNMRDRLAHSLMLALQDSFHLPNSNNYFAGVDTTGDGLPDFSPDALHFHSYYGDVSRDLSVTFEQNGPLNRTRRLAAGLASNIIASRMNEPLNIQRDVVPVPAIVTADEGSITGVSNNVGYLGMQPQPFLVEAFVAHVYKARQVPDQFVDPAQVDPDPIEYENAGDYFVTDTGEIDTNRGTIVVVQIANPYDVPIDLHEYRIDVFGQEYDLSFNLPFDVQYLMPSRDEAPNTAIFYAMPDAIGGDPIHDGTVPDDLKWQAFLDLNPTSFTSPDGGQTRIVENDDVILPPGTIIHRVDGAWSTSDRSTYDNVGGTTPGTIELVRMMPTDLGLEAVLVDRFDAPNDNEARSFGGAVEDMRRSRPAPLPYSIELLDQQEPDEDNLHPHVNEEDWLNYYFGPQNGNPHWVQWVRTTRAWGASTNLRTMSGPSGDVLMYEAHERNPRYVFGDKSVTFPTSQTTPDDSFEEYDSDADGDLDSEENGGATGAPEITEGGNLYDFDQPAREDHPQANDAPWFARTYYRMDGALMDDDPADGAAAVFPARRPTFFALGWMEGGWEGVAWNHDDRQYFMPDKGWYGQFELHFETTQELQDGLFRLIGPGNTDHPPFFLNQNEFNLNGVTQQIRFVDGTTSDWPNSSIPLIRQPFSMQMTMKNKMAWDVNDLGNTFAPSLWVQALINDQLGYSGVPLPQTLEWLAEHRDFEQIGELLNVWTFGHEVRGTLQANGTFDYSRTETTFSEHMSGMRRLAGTSADDEDLDEPLDPTKPRLWQLTGAPRPFASELRSRDAVNFDGGWVVNPNVSVLDEYVNWLRDGEPRRVNRLITQPRVYIDPTTGEGIALGAVVNHVHPVEFDPNNLAPYEAYVRDPRHAWPALPAGVRVLDLFVLDGPGRNVTNPDGLPSVVETLPRSVIDSRRYYNANEFDGRLTPGLINVNTAMPEVMRAMPHMTRLVHEHQDYPLNANPFSRVAESIVRYRDRLGVPVVVDGDVAAEPFPDYAQRGRGSLWAGGGIADDFFWTPDEITDLTMSMSRFVPGLRGERGMASIGELNLLTRSGRTRQVDGGGNPSQPKIYNAALRRYEYPSGSDVDSIAYNTTWRIDMPTVTERETWRLDTGDLQIGELEQAGIFLFSDGAPDGNATATSARLSTDTVDLFEPRFGNVNGFPEGMHPDRIAEDLQESNLLFSGISNMVTTRSDTFTVYFRVRTFRKNPETGIWDATNREHIVDDTRYVMLVDRSEVEKPSDRPKILYMEKVSD